MINDFIWLCFLSENNYLPGIHDVLFDDIVEVYKENYDYETIGFINDNGTLNEENLKKYLIKLKERINPINKMIYYLDKKMDSDPTKNNNSDKTNNDANNKTIKFVDDYCTKKNILSKVRGLCKDSFSNSDDIDCNDYKEIKYLEFIRSEFHLEREPKIIKVFKFKNTEKVKENEYINYLKLEKSCKQNDDDDDDECNIILLKGLSYEQEEKLIDECKKNNIKYDEIKYSTIKKGNNEKDIQSKIDEYDQKNIFLKAKEEYYKVKLFFFN